MENDKIIQNLRELGLSENEVKVYLATLELGGGLASEISKKAGVERVNTYHLLNQLILEGLVYKGERKNTLIFVAQGPAKLEAKAIEKLSSIRKILPELSALENLNQVKPKVGYFEGVEGIKQVFEDTLDLPKGAETLAYSYHKLDNQYLSEYIKDYIPRRVKKGITQRCIIERSEESLELMKGDKAELRECRLIDIEKFPFKNQINIYGDKMFIASYRDLMAVVIESKEVVDTQKAIFELAWIGAKESGK